MDTHPTRSLRSAPPEPGTSAPSSPAGGTDCQFVVEARDGGVIGIAVDGDLDPAAASTLIAVVESAIGASGTSRYVEIDLRGLRACSNSGVRALTTCAELGARVRDGLQFRVGIQPEVAACFTDEDYLSNEAVTLRT